MAKRLKQLQRSGLVLLAATAVFLTAACTATLLEPPRLATATAIAAQQPDAPPTPLLIEAPTATPGGNIPDATIDTSGNSASNPSLTVWINELSSDHAALLNEMADEFSTAYQVDVELMQVSPQLLPDLVQTAVLSNTLPDLILHPLEYSLGWTADGVFNVDAAEMVLDELGRETFNSDALARVTTGAGTAVLPSHGYQQLLIYRQDWVDERGMAQPTSFDTMFDFAEATFDSETFLTAGFVIPTESNLVTTHQAFEQIGRANGCQMIDETGEITLFSDPCLDALNFYYNIVHNFSPSGIQTVDSTRNAYLSGRTGMIMFDPSILPLLASSDPTKPPTCPECADNPTFLADNSTVVTTITGNQPEQSANFGTFSSLGITNVADVETAVLFASYWFNEGYPQWLAVGSARKVPMREGTGANGTQFIDAWGETAVLPDGTTLTDLYGAEAVSAMQTGVANAERWGFDQGQGALVSDLYQESTISIVLQELLSGYFDTSQTIFEAYNRIVEQIPAYSFPVIEPTETPEG